jgi:solute carrier family 25 oxoglutarate transporter 11
MSSPPKPTIIPPKPAPPGPKPAPPKSGALAVVKNFARGGLAGMFATCCIQPIDLVKVRIQLRSEKKGKLGKLSLSPFDVVKELFKEGGIKKFYTGIDSALCRQATYTTTRMGLYQTFFNMLKSKKKPGENLKFYEKAIISLGAGACAAMVGNPFDLALIRMQADNTLPVEQRRNYKHVIDAIAKTVKGEGISGLWKGAVPTVFRAMGLNFGMLGPYDEAKERLEPYIKNAKALALTSSAIAGFFAAFFSLPFDNIKTKLQKQRPLPDGTLPYKGFLNCMGKTVANEGFMKLWIGFGTYYVRIAPHAMITLMTTDFLKKYI